jgi:platelet-activating factor acetylhydrolase IB subunit beta/gamma
MTQAQEHGCDHYDLNVTQFPVPEQSPSQLRRQAELVQTMPASVDTILIGDSIFADWPQPDLDRLFAGRSVYNYSIGGDRTQNTLWRLDEPRLRTIEPQEVILLIGTNNLMANDKSCAIVAGISSIIRRVDELWRKPKVIVVDILPRGPSWSFKNLERRQVNDAVHRIIQSRGHAKTINADEIITCGRSTVCGTYRSDRVHLTPEGYAVLGKLFPDR